jgi:hypothetical protein
MAHDSKTRQALRRAYVIDRQPLKAAAAHLDVSYSTARTWRDEAKRNGDDWDRARMAEEIGDGGVKQLTRMVLQEFVPLFKTTIEAIKSAKLDAIDKAEAISRLSDAYMKTVKASGAVDPTIARLAWAMDVLRLLGQFTAERYPQHQTALIEILEPFGETLAAEYG